MRLLQRVEFVSKSRNRNVVLFCDSRFITNVNASTTSRITMPSFSAVIVQINGLQYKAILLAIVMFSFKQRDRPTRTTRLRFQVAILKSYLRFASYLPYEVLEHDDCAAGVKIMWVSPSNIVDGHFLIPIQGLRNSVPYNKLPPYQTYNIREGSRLYYSLSFSDYDVGTPLWSVRHTSRTYSSLRVYDKSPQIVHADRKVFLSPSLLKDMQAHFGFDNGEIKERPYRQGPKPASSRASQQRASQDLDHSQTRISMFFGRALSADVGTRSDDADAMSSASMSDDEEEDPLDRCADVDFSSIGIDDDVSD